MLSVLCLSFRSAGAKPNSAYLSAVITDAGKMAASIQRPLGYVDSDSLLG